MRPSWAEREQGLSPARIQELTGNRPWTAAVLRWARDGRRNRSGVTGPALAESLDAWAAEQTPGMPRPVTDGLDATRFPGSAQYEAHQRARAAHLHTTLAKAVQERAEAWDDLNALANDDDDADVDHPVNVRVVSSNFTRAADRFATHGRLKDTAE
ncbi:hypothetical protein [Streptomyces exfoliatus]|uniref:hypothetical protein n=1 Tax=Streptomyces exfoliatus TaxID=1905 RepID=UPI003C30BBFA